MKAKSCIIIGASEIMNRYAVSGLQQHTLRRDNGAACDADAVGLRHSTCSRTTAEAVGAGVSDMCGGTSSDHDFGTLSDGVR